MADNVHSIHISIKGLKKKNNGCYGVYLTMQCMLSDLSKSGSLAMISLFHYSRVSKFGCNMKLIFKLRQVHGCDTDVYAL